MPNWLTITMTVTLSAASLVLAPSVAPAAPIPEPVAEMIKAVKDDPDAFNAVVAAARKTNPDSEAEIDALVATLAANAQHEKRDRLATQGFFEGWTGEGEAGGFISTGNSDEGGLALGLSFDKETLRWRHLVDLGVDYQRSEGETTKERYSAGYGANYKFTERFYAVATLWAEKDKTADIRSRFIEGLGLGYRIVETASVQLGLEAGPAVRQTSYYDAADDNSAAARIAGNLAWAINPNTMLTHTATAYVESSNSTLEATIALTTKLMRAVAARASFEIRHETDPPPGEEKTDTTTRMTLVYSF